MPPTNSQALGPRQVSGIDFVIDRNFLQDLDPDHEYTLTSTTTETIKLSKSPRKSKESYKTSTYAPSTKKNRRGYSSSYEELSKPKRAPRDVSELFTRLISQIEDRYWELPECPEEENWVTLLCDVQYIQDHLDAELLEPRKATRLQTTLRDILTEAEEGKDVDRNVRSLRKGAKKGCMKHDLKDIREDYVLDWGEKVRAERKYLEQRKEKHEKAMKGKEEQQDK